MALNSCNWNKNSLLKYDFYVILNLEYTVKSTDICQIHVVVLGFVTIAMFVPIAQ